MESSTMLRLPRYHTHLVGRTAEVADLTTRLNDPETRMLTIVGASGAGKTRLALEAAAAVADTFHDGEVFVALAPVQDPRFVMSTIATALGIMEQGQTPLLETVAEALAERRMLLILDNVEQVMTAAADVAALLALAPGLTCLLTSQVAMAVAPEIIYVLPPLALPDDTIRDPAMLMEYAAIALFVARIREVQPDFQLTAMNAPSVLDLCRLLQGYPLAIELVAAHSTALAPSDLLLLLRNHLRLVPASRTSLPSSRSAVLHPVLDWCASRLPKPTRQLFEQLGVFFGGATAEAVQTVLAPELDPIAVRSMLDLLVQKHLIQVETLPDQGDRYVMLDAIHDYSTQCMVRRTQQVRIRWRHATYYQTQVAAIEADLTGGEQTAALRWLDEEIHNLRAALTWLIQQQQTLAAVCVMTATVRFWLARQAYSEARYWLEPLVIIDPASDLSAWAKGWRVLGVMALEQGDYPAAERYFTYALTLYQRSGDHAGEGHTLANWGLLYRLLGQMEQAQEAFNRSLQAYHQVEPIDQASIDLVMGNLAVIYCIQGRFDQAQSLLEDIAASEHQREDWYSLAITLVTLMTNDLERGWYAEALARWEECRRIATLIEDNETLGIGLVSLGFGAIEYERYDEAQDHFAAAAALYDEPRTPPVRAMLDHCTGALAMAQGHWAVADQALSAAREQFEELGNIEAPDVYLHLCEAAASQGAMHRAWEFIYQFLVQAEAAQAQTQLIRGAEMAAVVLAALNHHTSAVSLWQAAEAHRGLLGMERSPRMQRWYALHGAHLTTSLESRGSDSPLGLLSPLIKQLVSHPPVVDHPVPGDAASQESH